MRQFYKTDFLLKKLFYILISIVILSIISLVIYWNLPIEITRKNDIKFGNKLIENISSYQSQFNELPKNDDWKTLENLGFEIEILGTKPSYEYNQNGEYELVFLEGFDGPYLMWNSKEKKWKIDFPTILTESNQTLKISGKTVIFLRPSDKKFKKLEDENRIF